jgi:hypothetical protein
VGFHAHYYVTLMLARFPFNLGVCGGRIFLACRHHLDVSPNNNTRIVNMDDALGASPWRKLPAELRNEIYFEALRVEGGITLRLTYKGRGQQRALTVVGCDKGFRANALLRTCKEIRSEARSVFYAVNAFTIRSSIPDRNLQAYRRTRNAFRQWIDRTGSPTLNLTSLTVDFGCLWMTGLPRVPNYAVDERIKQRNLER